MAFLPEQTIHYKTYLKTALVEGLRPVFTNHPDSKLQGTKVSLDFPNTKEQYPAVIVRFFERQIFNAGVGHVEFIYDNNSATDIKYRHYFYNGDIEFALYALSSLDRDLLADSLVQTLAMGDVAAYTQLFRNRIYSPNITTYPLADWNFITLGTDVISGFGETQLPAPWQPEDVLVYQTSYRIPVFGEFYSVPSDTVVENITSINFYPYLEGDPVPTGSTDPAPWNQA